MAKLISTFLILSLIFSLLIVPRVTYAAGPGPICGDSTCDPTESCRSCPADCSTGCGFINQPGVITNPALGNGLQELLQRRGGIGFFGLLLPNLITLSLILGSIIFFFMLVIGGIQWTAAGTDKSAVEAARGRLTHALIGIVVLFSIFAIISLVEEFFGISILTIDISSLQIK